MANPITDAILDPDDGILADTSVGAFRRDNLERKESTERREQIIQNREKRRAVEADDLGQATRLTERAGTDVDEVIATARALGFNVNTLEDALNVNRDDIAKMAVEKGENVEQLVREYENARASLNLSVDKLRRAGVATSKIINMLKVRSLAKGELSANIMDTISGGGVLNLTGTPFNNIDCANLTDEQRKKLKSDIRNHYGKQYGDAVKSLNTAKIADYEASARHHERMGGMEAAAIAKEEFKIIESTLSEVSVNVKNAIFASPAFMKSFSDGDFGKISEDLRLVAQGKASDTIFAGDSALLEKLSTAKGRSDAGKMARILGNMGSLDGEIGGDLVMNAENAVGLMLHAAMSEHMKAIAQNNIKMNEHMEMMHMTRLENSTDQTLGVCRSIFSSNLGEGIAQKLTKIIKQGESGYANSEYNEIFQQAIDNFSEHIAAESDPAKQAHMQQHLFSLQSMLSNRRGYAKVNAQTDRLLGFTDKMNSRYQEFHALRNDPDEMEK